MMFVLVTIRIIAWRHREEKIPCNVGERRCDVMLRSARDSSVIAPWKNSRITRIHGEHSCGANRASITAQLQNRQHRWAPLTAYAARRRRVRGEYYDTVDTRGSIMRSPNETRCVPERQIPIQLRSPY